MTDYLLAQSSVLGAMLISPEIEAYGGPLGDALSSINGIIGDNKAYMENLGEQYQREALSAVFLGQDTTVYNAGDSEKLRKMGAEYRGASFEYEQTGSREAALTMERLKNEVEALSGPTNDTYFDIDPASVGGFAYGLGRVPYDDYPALLHEGERVLTAQAAREADRGGAPGPVSVHVDTLNVRQESDIHAVAEELADLIEQKRMAGVRT